MPFSLPFNVLNYIYGIFWGVGGYDKFICLATMVDSKNVGSWGKVTP